MRNLVTWLLLSKILGELKLIAIWTNFKSAYSIWNEKAA